MNQHPQRARTMTAEQVVWVREQYAARRATPVAMARQLGVPAAAVRRAVRGEIYRTFGGPITTSRRSFVERDPSLPAVVVTARKRGMKIDEIAAVLDCSPSSVKRLARKAG